MFWTEIRCCKISRSLTAGFPIKVRQLDLSKLSYSLSKLPKIKVLIFDNNNLTSESALSMCRIVSSCNEKGNSLIEVGLAFNAVNDLFIEEMIPIFQQAKSLRILSLRGNAIGQKGIKLLGDLLDENRSLISMDLRENPGLAKKQSLVIVNKLKRNWHEFTERTHNPQETIKPPLESLPLSKFKSNCSELIPQLSAPSKPSKDLDGENVSMMKDIDHSISKNFSPEKESKHSFGDFSLQLDEPSIHDIQSKGRNTSSPQNILLGLEQQESDYDPKAKQENPDLHLSLVKAMTEEQNNVEEFFAPLNDIPNLQSNKEEKQCNSPKSVKEAPVESDHLADKKLNSPKNETQKETPSCTNCRFLLDRIQKLEAENKKLKTKLQNRSLYFPNMYQSCEIIRLSH